MGAIGIVALVIVVLIVSAIGFQNLLAAIGVAIFFALFLRYLTDEYYKFSEGLSGAIVSLGIAGILSIFIDAGFWGFWIAYIVVLLFWGFSLKHNVVKFEKEAQPVLKDLQDFLEVLVFLLEQLADILLVFCFLPLLCGQWKNFRVRNP